MVMATSLLGTAFGLDQRTLPAIATPIKPSNGKVSTTNAKPNSRNVPSNPSTVPSRNNEIENKKPNNARNKGVSPPTDVVNAENKGKLQSNEEKVKQQKPQPVKDGNGTNGKIAPDVAERPKVEKSARKDVSPLAVKPQSIVEKTKPISAAVSEPKVEKNSHKAIDSGKDSANVESTNQQLQERVIKNANSTNNKQMSDADCERGANAGKHAPKLESTTNAKLLQQGPFPEPGSKVKISYVAENKIYIYETGPGPNGERNGVEVLIARTLECARSVKDHLSAPPAVGDIVFADFDGEYYRAVVKSVKSDGVQVFYPDFGNSQTVKWNTLKEIPDPKIKYANCLTHGVWIENIATFTPNVKKFLQQLENEADFLLITVIDVQNTADIKMVELYHCSEKYHLSAKLLDLQTACPMPKQQQQPPKPKSPEKASKWVITNPKTYKPVLMEELIDPGNIEQGKGIELVIVNASCAFTENQLTVMTKENYAIYETMMKECEIYGKIDPNPYEPKEGEICLVCTKGVWSRAVSIMPQSTNSVWLFLLDQAAFVENDDVIIRRYPPGMTRQQFMVECVLENSNFLLKAIGGDERNVNKACGKLIKADIYISMDEELEETTHLTIFHSVLFNRTITVSLIVRLTAVRTDGKPCTRTRSAPSTTEGNVFHEHQFPFFHRRRRTALLPNALR
uniref:Tudor domain-containing protein n=1 Tax=Anopheles culicifacies TaxID=139723 RepID=A0A182MB71_9DIPT